MFTLAQILHAHSTVKTGADFPAYIQAIKKLGVLSYETFVSDLHTDYFGINGYKISKEASGEIQNISDNPNSGKFKSELKAHQQGKTDFAAFRKACIETGIEKWMMNLEKMTCTYYDKKGNIIFEEKIPDITFT